LSPVGDRDMSHDISRRVSWTTCPVCGGHLAIGWDKPEDRYGEVPVEFDCVNRCQLTLSQALETAMELSPARARPGPINGRA